MTPWLAPLLAALEDLGGTTWFFRDDDAGWSDRRLEDLIDTFRRGGVRLDLAAIPAAVSPGLGRRLAGLVDEGTVAVHQHGWSHANHEPLGRRAEFGLSRAAEMQVLDLRRGRRLLAERLERPPTAVFIPPWNRCTQATAELLPGVGLTVLSADRTAPVRGVPGLVEVPVAVDWTRAVSRGGLAGLAAELVRATAGAPAPIGVMLHHAVMDGEERAALRELLALLDHSAGATLTDLASLSAPADESDLTSISLPGHGAPAR